MALALGSSGLMVSAWTAVMLKRFSSYALGRNGLPIKVDGYFGFDEVAVQEEYQRRTGQAPTGKVTDQDLHRLGLLPTLITTHGTGQPDPFGIGYPADYGRRLLHLYYWQPTGNYPATAVPMNKSAAAGAWEINRFINTPTITPGPVAFVDYSQGSICGGRVRNRIRVKADEHTKRVTLLGGVTFGNPMRPKDAYAGNVNPGGAGIDPVLETASEPGMLHLAAKGDLYTTNPGGDAGEWERAIFNLVFSRFTGRDSILEQIGEWLAKPMWETIAAGRAILRGGMFAARGTGPHVRYHIDQCPGTGMTYYEYGIRHLEQLAVARLEGIVSAAIDQPRAA